MFLILVSCVGGGVVVVVAVVVAVAVAVAAVVVVVVGVDSFVRPTVRPLTPPP